MSQLACRHLSAKSSASSALLQPLEAKLLAVSQRSPRDSYSGEGRPEPSREGLLEGVTRPTTWRLVVGRNSNLLFRSASHTTDDLARPSTDLASGLSLKNSGTDPFSCESTLLAILLSSLRPLFVFDRRTKPEHLQYIAASPQLRRYCTSPRSLATPGATPWRRLRHNKPSISTYI